MERTIRIVHVEVVSDEVAEREWYRKIKYQTCTLQATIENYDKNSQKSLKRLGWPKSVLLSLLYGIKSTVLSDFIQKDSF